MRFRHFIAVKRNDRGAAMIEYSLMAACLALVVIAAAAFTGNQSRETLHKVGEHIQDALSENPPGGGCGHPPPC